MFLSFSTLQFSRMLMRAWLRPWVENIPWIKLGWAAMMGNRVSKEYSSTVAIFSSFSNKVYPYIIKLRTN